MAPASGLFAGREGSIKLDAELRTQLAQFRLILLMNGFYKVEPAY